MKDINFLECKLLLAFLNFSDLNASYVIRHNVAYILKQFSADMRYELMYISI